MSQSNGFPTPSNPSHPLPKVIYSPEQWSDGELGPTQSDPISAEIVESGDLTSSISTASIEVNEFNPQPEQLTENMDLLTLARKLRQQNRELLKTVVQLEQALTESQHQLHHQKLRSRSTETLLTQQTQQLTNTQGQVTKLTQELEQAQQLAQHQQLILETLTQELKSTQQQTATLERECAFLKEDNNEKTQKLIFLEQQIQEFRSRLHRQQRYTLQYKAALEQCLDFPQTQFDHSSTISIIAPKERAIQPWSSNWQQNTSFPLPESKLEIDSYEPDIDDEFDQPITVSFNEEEIDYTPDINLSNSSLNIDENEEDTFLDEFFASFEPDELSLNESVKKPVSSNWPSPIISPISPGQKSSSKIVDLPNFLRP